MTAETYTRSITITIDELVPDKTMLPQCGAWLVKGPRCPNPGKYKQNDLPICGLHLGRPGLLFHPETRKPKEAT